MSFQLIGLPDNAAILVNSIVISDTNVHNYRTDPQFINLIELYPAFPPPKAYALFVINQSNQTLNVQPIGNIFNNQQYPDYSVGPSFTVGAGSSTYVTFPFENYPTNFLSVNLSYSTAPSPPAVIIIFLLVFR